MAEHNSAVRRVAELFETCRALHRQSYPHSLLDFDRWDLTGRLTHETRAYAKGKFSDVYRGTRDNGLAVAVKTLRLPEHNLHNDKVYQTVLLRFFREINIWSALDHPNIASCLGYTLTGGDISLVSSWHKNGNLVEFLRTSTATRTTTSEPDLILDVAEGIQYLHTCMNPLIHGDLKGANILVSEHGIARLADFGISKQIDDMNRQTGFTTSSGVTGTMPWMAPELDENSRLTFSSDVYSCAGVFLEIYCPGKTPYHYLSSRELMRAKDAGVPPDLLQYPEFTRRTALWGIMSACWTHDPQGRPSITIVVQSLYSLFGLSPRVHQTVALRPVKKSAAGQSRTSVVKGLSLGSIGSEPRKNTAIDQDHGPTMGQMMAMQLQDVPIDHLQKGSDWHAIVNPSATRMLKISPVMALIHDSPVSCVQFSPDGKYLATGCRGVVYVYDTTTGEKTHILARDDPGVQEGPFHVKSVAFSPDRQLVASAYNCTLRIWGLAEGKIRTIFYGHTREVTTVAFSPCGNYVVSGSWDGTCRIWDLLTGEATVLTCTGARSQAWGIWSVAFSPDGLFVASGHHDCIVRLWDASTGCLVKELQGHTDWIRSVVFTPDGRRLISGSEDGTVEYWNLNPLLDQTAAPSTGGIVPLKRIRSFLEPRGRVLSVATSHGGSWVVGGSHNGMVGIWDMKNPRIPQLMLHGHESWVNSVDIGPALAPGTVDGLLATGSQDRSARIWSYKTV